MKKLLISLIIVIAILAANLIGMSIRYNQEIDNSNFWYQKYIEEKESHETDIKSISETIFLSTHGRGIVTDNWLYTWYEDEYGGKVFLNEGIIRVIK